MHCRWLKAPHGSYPFLFSPELSPSAGRLEEQPGGERAAMCRVLRPRGPPDTCLHPEGHGRLGQLVCFGEVQSQTGQKWECRLGGRVTYGLQADRGLDRLTGGGEAGGVALRRITEHKRLVSKTEWAVTTYNPMMIMTQGRLEPQGTQSRVCVCVCDVSWCPTE